MFASNVFFSMENTKLIRQGSGFNLVEGSGSTRKIPLYSSISTCTWLRAAIRLNDTTWYQYKLVRI